MSSSWEVRQVVVDSDALDRERQLFRKYATDKQSGYVRFYAERQDHIIRARPDLWRQFDKRFAIDYLREHGLEPHHRLLDYGCGTASAGQHIINYLEPQKYVGVDISAESIRLGWTLLANQALYRKGPVLHAVPDGRLDVLKDLEFDVIWAQSVFTHCPPDVIKAILTALRQHLAERGCLYATFARIDNGIVQRQLHDWYYTTAFFEELASECGYACTVMDDWVHPAECLHRGFSMDTMLKFVPL